MRRQKSCGRDADQSLQVREFHLSDNGVNQDLGDLPAKAARRREPFFLESSRQRMPEIPPHLNASITIIVIRERIVIKVLNRAAVVNAQQLKLPTSSRRNQRRVERSQLLTDLFWFDSAL